MSLDIYMTDIGKATGMGYTLFDMNITHNVAPMWRVAGIYDELYNSGGKKPKKIIAALKRGLEDMKAKPYKYKPLNPPNKWGDYNSAMNFLTQVINACEQYPEAIISISK